MSDTPTRITCASLNCRGLKKVLTPSGRSLARHIRSLSYDIVALQETHADSFALHDRFDTCLQVRSSTWTSHCGLISYNPALEITPEWAALSGRLLVARVTHRQQLCADLLVYVIYAPAIASDRPAFFKALHPLLNFSSPPTRRSILLGDFNHNIHTLSTRDDDMNRWLQWARTFWYDAHHTSAFRSSLPTYRHISTIDFLLFTPDLADYIAQPDNRYVPCCDHAAVSVVLSLGIPKPGPGLWRFNAQFLENKYFCAELKVFLMAAERYLPTSDVSSTWDLFKTILKKFAQDFGRKHQGHQRRRHLSLQKQWKSVLRQMQHSSSGDTNLIARLGGIEAELDRIEEHRADTMALRSGQRWREDGERSTAYFYRCLRERHTKQQITALQKSNGSLSPANRVCSTRLTSTINNCTLRARSHSLTLSPCSPIFRHLWVYPQTCAPH